MQKYSKELERPNLHVTGNKALADCSPVVIEEYALETERPQVILSPSELSLHTEWGNPG